MLRCSNWHLQSYPAHFTNDKNMAYTTRAIMGAFNNKWDYITRWPVYGSTLGLPGRSDPTIMGLLGLGWDAKRPRPSLPILVCSFILRMRDSYPAWKVCMRSTLLHFFGFATVNMTYFGVNYYLSGLHSYAQVIPESPFHHRFIECPYTLAIARPMSFAFVRYRSRSNMGL